MSYLVSSLLTLRLHLNDCDFDSRPLFLVSLFLSLYIHIHVYILLLLLYTIFLVTDKTGTGLSSGKRSFSTSDTIVTLYRHRSTNRFVSLMSTQTEAAASNDASQGGRPRHQLSEKIGKDLLCSCT